MVRLVEWWPTLGSPELLENVVHRMEGPLPGGWAGDTTNDFLLVLVDAGKETDASVRRVWIGLLGSRLFGDRERSYFHGTSDGALTQVAAQLVAKGGAAEELEPFETAMRSACRAVTRPFARSSYARWASARDRVLWGEAFARLVADKATPGSELHTRAGALVAAASGVGPYLEQEKLGIEDPTGLVPFVEAVRKGL